MDYANTPSERLADQLRDQKLRAPDQPRFDPDFWEKQKTSRARDEQDRNVAEAILFFHSGLERLRKRMKFGEMTLSVPEVARFGVAHLNHESRKLVATGRKQGALSFDRNYVVSNAGLAGPDEMFTGLADGMKHFLIVNAKRAAPAAPGDSANPEQRRLILSEVSNARDYQVLREFLHEVTSNDHALVSRGDLKYLVPRDRELEISRAVSNFRRFSSFRTDFLSNRGDWLRPPSLDECRKRCDIELVTDVTIRDGRVADARFGRTDEVLYANANALQGRAEILAGYFAALLDRPLSKPGCITVRELLRARLFLQSLSLAIASRMPSYVEGEVLSFDLAPVIDRSLLAKWLAHGLGIGKLQVKCLLDAMTFNFAYSEDLFLRPFVPTDDDNVCVALECMNSLHWVRVVEHALVAGCVALGERGLFFEPYCRRVLRSRLHERVAKRGVFVLPEALAFCPTEERKHQIDIVLVFGTTILLLEVKCFLTPYDTAEVGRYAAKVRKAAEQIGSAVCTVRDHYGAFAKALRDRGYKAPDHARVIGAVLPSCGFLSGHAFGDIPVTDIGLMVDFITGSREEIAMNYGSGPPLATRTALYKNVPQGAGQLKHYLRAPPHLRDIRASVEPRGIAFWIDNEVLFVHETWQAGRFSLF